ncbi:proteasome activator complex subunit 1 isoform X2 [Mobula hypostoma]|uniref:proteasome activator complex subunit 1 isoform X2 n=1 Tax=Mobula hypostoma TaxID=723540 RepID=UPI002FC376E8
MALGISGPAQELVNGFKRDLCIQAETLLADFFPRKLLELDALLKEEELNIPDPGSIRSELDIPIPDPAKDKLKEEEKKKKAAEKKDKEEKGKDEKEDKEDDEDSGPPCGPVSSNERIVALLGRVKPEVALLKEKSSVVSIWLQVQIPKIEDGNNFGVQVQEKVFEGMTGCRTKIEGFQTQITKYFQERGDAVAKAAKEQHVGDYRQLVHQIDEAQYSEIRAMVMEIRNQYALLYDLISKNFDKIKKPRGDSKALIY